MSPMRLIAGFIWKITTVTAIVLSAFGCAWLLSEGHYVFGVACVIAFMAVSWQVTEYFSE